MLKILEDINSLYEISKNNQEARPTLLKAARILLKHVEYLLLDDCNLSEYEIKALKSKQKIEAIKLYRTRTGTDLKTAKDFIEKQIIDLGLGRKMLSLCGTYTYIQFNV